MNRIRLMVLTGVLTVGGWGLLAPPARAQFPTGPAPQYVYGFGPSGYGYYNYAAPPRPYYDPAPFYNYDPAWRLASPTQAGSQSGGSYSYYDADGVEYDSRYPHWSSDPRKYLPH